MEDILHKRSQRLSLTACAILVFDPVKNGIIQFVRSYVSIPMKLDTLLMFGILAVLVISVLPDLLSVIGIPDLLGILVLSSFFIISRVRTQGYDWFYSSIMKDMAMGVASYVVIRAVRDADETVRYLRLFSIVIMIFQVLNAGGGFEDSYNQYYGYTLLIPTIISLDAALDPSAEYRMLQVGNCVLAAGFTVFSGARGPLLVIGLFVILKILLGLNYDRRRQILYISIIAVIGLLVWLYMIPIVLWLSKQAASLNLSTRVFDSILNGTMGYMDDRQKIYDRAIDILNSRPSYCFFGYGMGRERIALAEMFGEPQEALAFYPHNILIEFVVHYGYPIGIFFLAMLAFVFYYGCTALPGSGWCSLVHILIAMGVLPLFASESYLTSQLFYCAIAASINVFEKKNQMEELPVYPDGPYEEDEEDEEDEFYDTEGL